MKSLIKKTLCILSSLAILSTAGYFGRNWINTRIDNAIAQYAQKDKQWTKQKMTFSCD